MTEEDCEIEYLDEDEDLIQQFVQVAPTVNAPVAKKKTTTKKAPAVEKKPTRITRSSRKALDENAYEEENTNSLLEERSEVKRKLRSEEDSEAIEELSQVVKIRKKNDAIVENAPVVGKQPTRTTGQVHTSLWHKLQVKDKNGKEKSEVYQNTLPYFREKILLKPFSVIKANPQRFRNKHEVLLSKEVNKDEEYLVAYNPGDAVSAVYKYFNQSDTLTEGDDRKPRLVIKEASCNKICAPCYQTSWRGVRKRENASIQCVICKRTFVTVYNLLSHLKTHHKNEEVRSHKAALARSLAKAVDYHYKCRICQETFLSIKLLRKHVNRHQADEPLEFHCEIGNHIAK